MTIPVRQVETPEYVLDEDGDFRCPHDDVEITYEQGGDGITEPLGGWYVYCNDCDNEDMTDSQIENYLSQGDDNE